MIAPTPRCYGYGRISNSKSEAMTAECTKEAQEAACRQLYETKVLASDPDVLWGGFFWDEAVSAKHGMLTRPAGGKLIVNVIRPGDWIVASTMDRMFRLTLDAVSMLTVITEHKRCRLVLGNLSNMDLNTPEGRLIFNTFANLAQFEREQVSQRNKNAIKYRKAHGLPWRGKLIGAVSRATKVGKHWVPNHDQRAFAREVIRVYEEEGLSVRAVKERFNIPSTKMFYAYRRAVRENFPLGDGWMLDDDGTLWHPEKRLKPAHKRAPADG